MKLLFTILILIILTGCGQRPYINRSQESVHVGGCQVQRIDRTLTVQNNWAVITTVQVDFVSCIPVHTTTRQQAIPLPVLEPVQVLPTDIDKFEDYGA